MKLIWTAVTKYLYEKLKPRLLELKAKLVAKLVEWFKKK